MRQYNGHVCIFQSQPCYPLVCKSPVHHSCIISSEVASSSPLHFDGVKAFFQLVTDAADAVSDGCSARVRRGFAAVLKQMLGWEILRSQVDVLILCMVRLIAERIWGQMGLYYICQFLFLWFCLEAVFHCCQSAASFSQGVVKGYERPLVFAMTTSFSTNWFFGHAMPSSQTLCWGMQCCRFTSVTNYKKRHKCIQFDGMKSSNLFKWFSVTQYSWFSKLSGFRGHHGQLSLCHGSLWKRSKCMAIEDSLWVEQRVGWLGVSG